MRRLQIALTVGTLTLISLGSGAFAASARATRAPISTGVCGSAATRPGAISLAVDGSSFLAGQGPAVIKYDKLRPGTFAPLVWSSWTSDSARTTETEMVDTDRPSVGAGTLVGFTAAVHLSRPVNGVFTRMLIVTTAFRDFNRQYGTDYTSYQPFSASFCRGGGVGWTPDF